MTLYIQFNMTYSYVFVKSDPIHPARVSFGGYLILAGEEMIVDLIDFNGYCLAYFLGESGHHRV